MAHDLGTICREKGEMKASLRKNSMSVRWLTLVIGAGGTWLGIAGCSSTSTLVPQAPPQEVAVPAYAYLPHPRGYTAGDIRLLLTEKSAPSPEALTKCEDDFRALYKRVDSLDERARGVRELVNRNPAAYHWCFYSRILDLEAGLGQDDFVDEKQKRIIHTYEYLVPVARAFMQEFQDSRYIRWAIKDYRRLADLYFYRKVELSPQMSSELVDVAVPVEEKSAVVFEDASKTSVIDKYKIGDSFSALKPKPVPNKDEEAPAPALPAPEAAPVAAAKPEPKKPAAPDPEEVETVEYANQLAQQRKGAQANRAPAQLPPPGQPPVPPSPETAAPVNPENPSQFSPHDPSEQN